VQRAALKIAIVAIIIAGLSSINIVLISGVISVIAQFTEHIVTLKNSRNYVNQEAMLKMSSVKSF